MSSGNAETVENRLADTSKRPPKKLCATPDQPVPSVSVDLFGQTASEYSRLAAPNLVPRTEKLQTYFRDEDGGPTISWRSPGSEKSEPLG